MGIVKMWKHVKRVESILVEVGKLCCPRVMMKNYLVKIGRRQFAWSQFALGLVKRHKEELPMKFCRNIKR